MKWVFLIYFSVMVTFACTQRTEKNDSFFGDYIKYLSGEESLEVVYNNYFRIAPELNVEYLSALNGTRVNILCSFYEEYKGDPITLDINSQKNIDENIRVMGLFLRETKNAGNKFNRCVTLFGLKVVKNLRTSS